jgi:hypothetical protein
MADQENADAFVRRDDHGIPSYVASQSTRTRDCRGATRVVPFTVAPPVARSPELGDASTGCPPATHSAGRGGTEHRRGGDAADIRTSRAGSVTHFGCETVVDKLGHLLEGDPLVESSDGHAHCFIETSYHEAVPASTPDRGSFDLFGVEKVNLVPTSMTYEIAAGGHTIAT